MRTQTKWVITSTLVGVLAIAFFVEHSFVQIFADVNPPARPINLTATTLNNNIILTWQPGVGSKPTWYRIYRSSSPNGHYERINHFRIIKPTFTDSNAAQQGYWYKVSAVKLVGGDNRHAVEGPAAGPITVNGNIVHPSPSPLPSVTLPPTSPAPTPSPTASPTLSITGTLYYVGPDGNDSNSCTDATHRCKSINVAINKTAAGHNDGISIANHGTYDAISIKNYGQNLDEQIAKTKPLVLIGEGSDITIKPDAKTNMDVFVQNAKGITFNHLTVTGKATNNLRVLDSSDITITNSEFAYGTSACILIVRTSNVMIDNVLAHESLNEHGIYISDKADNVSITHSYLYGNGAAGVQVNAEKLAGETYDSVATNVMIKDNVIYNNGAQGGSAINLIGVQQSTIENNLLAHNYSAGISAIWRDDGTPNNIAPAGGPKDLKIDHNTIVMSDTNPVRNAPVRYAVQLKDTFGSVTLTNNILYQKAGKALWIYDSNKPDTANLVSDNNIYANTSQTSLYDDRTKFSLSDWQKGAKWSGANNTQNDTHDQHSNVAVQALADIFNQPDAFTNPTNGSITTQNLTNFRPKSTITAGANL